MLTVKCFIKIIYFTSFVAIVVASTTCLQCKQQKCDGNKNCLDGCIPGFAGQTCLHECPSNCIDSLCNFDGKTGAYPCSIGCKPGYFGLQCNTPCGSIDEEGKCDRFSGTFPDCDGISYGEDCRTSCLSKCGGSACDNKGKCLKEVCIPGRYGAGCNQSCENNCKLCHRITGKCILNAEKDVLDNSRCSCDNSGTAQVNNDSGYLIFILILLVINSSVCGLGILILYKMNLKIRNTSQMSIDRVKESREKANIHTSDAYRGIRKRKSRSCPETMSLMESDY